MTLDDLFRAYPARFERAFLAAIEEIKNRLVLADIEAALLRGDVSAAIEAMYIDRAAFREFERELEAAFSDGGAAQIDDLGRLEDQQGNRFVFRFDARNLRAERAIRDHSSNLVTGIVDDQRTAVRQALEDGLARGSNPRTSALDVVGRFDRRTGTRTGGVIGLSSTQERAVANARRDLETGDYSSYLQREKRDRRFDSTVRKAAKEGRSLTKEEIRTLTSRYSDRLLKLRGDTIARTETLSALNLGRYQSIEQLIATGRVRAQDVRLVWNATKDGRTRDVHRAMDGDSVGFGESFVTPRGARLQYPGDPAGGPAEVINCRCALRVRIDRRGNR